MQWILPFAPLPLVLFFTFLTAHEMQKRILFLARVVYVYFVYVGIRGIEPRRRVFLDVGLRPAGGVYS